MKSSLTLGLAVLLALTPTAKSLHIPPEVEQPPTITGHTSSPVVALPLPFDDGIIMSCEARGNPPPKYRWTKDGEKFTPPHDSTSSNTQPRNGNFLLAKSHLAEMQGKYRCYAYNKLGTAMTEEIELIAPSVPKFPKEKIDPIVVEEGQPVVLKCNPPGGVAPRKLYWMSIGLHLIEQDDRVSMDTKGNLYFSNTIQNDSRHDYCCFASFPEIRTIVQKSTVALVVNSLRPKVDGDNSTVPLVREPSLLLPSGIQMEVLLVKGEELELECIPEGFPTPKVEWIKMGEKLPERTKIKNYGKLLTIPRVEEEDDGTYMCKAKNSAGQAVHYFDVKVEEPPKWLPEAPQSRLVVTGEAVHIKCSVWGKPPPDIVWRKNGQVLKDDDQRQVLDDTVVLLAARPEDSAVYQCEAINRHGRLLANINIMVMNMAPLMLTGDSREYAVIRGQHALIDCSVFGSPPPTITWEKGQAPVITKGGRFTALQNGSLLVTSAKKEDSGKYVCSANNTEGKSSVTAKLAVKDSTRIVDPPQDLQTLSGSIAQFTCQAEIDKSLTSNFKLTWMKDGREEMYIEDPRFSVDEGVLQIVNVNLGDQGVYTCIARTNLDEARASAVLTVLDVPDAPGDLEMSEQNGRSVRLSWVPGSDHNSSSTEFVVEYEESIWEPGRWRELQRVPGNWATASLALQGNLDYQFRVYAVNAVGPGPPSRPTGRYTTPITAPDRNPESVKIQGHLPHQMDISWEPLLPVEHNGPTLEYKVSYRRLAVDDVWKEEMVKRHSFRVKDTPTFVPYEVKVQSRNGHGWGPEPKVVTGYSGEDVPTAAPRDVAVEVMNSTLVRVSWTPVPRETVRGHLGGYNVHWVRRRSLLHPNKIPDERSSLAFRGNRSHGMVPGLAPFSEYTLTVNVFNRKGSGPGSDPVTFHTPEGVPDQLPILTASNAQGDSISLVWGPPLEANGALTGYLLKYQLVNETTLEVVNPPAEVNVSGADNTQWRLRGLEVGRLYRFQLSACTRAGCGPPLSQEGTLAQPHLSPTPAEAPAGSTLLNISSYVSDTFAKISWIAINEPQDSQLYVAYMNNREGNWRISQPVNTSQMFYMIDGLEPGAVYTVRLIAKHLLDNASVFEDVIQTQVKGPVSQEGQISTQGWLIGTMCAMVLLTLIVLIACFVKRNKGGKYAGTLPQQPDMSVDDEVKEREDLHPDVESQRMNDNTSGEYSDCDEKPPQEGSLCSISRDSLVVYADDGEEFNEDGSFIGEYSARVRRVSVGATVGPGSATA